jgi:hypothetical protein
MKYCLLISIFLFTWLGTYAQSPVNNIITKEIKVSNEWISIDSCLILPSSILLRNSKGIKLEPKKDFLLDSNKILITNRSLDKNETFTLSCRCLNTLGTENKKSILNEDQLSDSYRLIYKYDESFKELQLLDNGRGLKSSGVFSRSIGIGNNQNLVLNSTFNLQLSGDIGDNIQVRAAISDANIPIQPEGNTQQLNEFDRVFIELKKDDTKLLLGDYQQGDRDSYFLKYFKKLQGVQFSQETLDLGKGQMQLKSSFALTKGKFARNAFNGEEGNQGPYKLTGAEGETFIIVLANTEKVYIDGKLLTRGFDNDYIIDYNAGTITFTVRQPMTTERRIIIEFEYNDQSYLRSLYTVNGEYKRNNLRIYSNIYAEQDGKSRVGEGPLDQEQQSILAQAGDDIRLAGIPAIDTSSNSTDPINYILKDTFINNTVIQILEYSPTSNPEEITLYNAFFSNLGAGNGNYQQTNLDANGIVFEFVGSDDNGNLLGSYEPIRLLPLPQSKKLINLGIEQGLGESGIISTELALSQNDINKLSTLDAEDDWGIALFSTLKKVFNQDKTWSFSLNSSHEWKQKNFRSINPYRLPEFNRNWDLGANNSSLEPMDEHLGNAAISILNNNKNINFDYNLSFLTRGNEYRGIQHTGQGGFSNKNWNILGKASVLNSNTSSTVTKFQKPSIAIGRKFGKSEDFEIQFNWFEERNERRDLNSDSLINSSFAFNQSELKLILPEKHNFSWTFYTQNRRDFSVIEQDLKMWKNAYNIGIDAKLKNLKNTQLTTQINYRKFDDILEELPEEKGQLMGKLNLNQQFFKGVIRLTTLYQITAGQEQKVQFIYQQVNPGEGNYQHIDFNEDGIEQASEFVLAPNPDQGTHIRVIYYANEFIKTNNALYNQNINISPKALWFNKKGFKKALSYLSFQSNWQLEQKVQETSQGVIYWHPLQRNISEEDIVNDRSNIRNSIWINRGGKKMDIQVSQTIVSISNLLLTGLEKRQTEDNTLSIRWNFTSKTSIRINGSIGEKSADIEQYTDRSFSVSTKKIQPELSFFPTENSRLILKSQYESFIDRDFNIDNGSILDINLESQINSTLGLFEGGFLFSNVNYSGNPNSPIGFALLNGLQSGKNFQWTLGINRKINKSLRLGLRYEGRKNGNINIIHTGNLQFSAFF